MTEGKSAISKLKDAAKRHPVLVEVYWAVFKLKRYIEIHREWIKFKSETRIPRFTISWKDRRFYCKDASPFTDFDSQYIYHTAWAARSLAKTKPASHTDISSFLYFSTIVSAFIPVKFYDYRPANVHLSNLISEHANITALPFEDGSIKSLSCLHTVEHIGLGRYGDTIDPDGDLKAIAELKRVLALGGNLLFAVPVGKEARIIFNGHRIYTYDQVITYFKGLKLVEYSLITDNPELDIFIENADPKLTDMCLYGCGCFWFMKDRG
jgi:SAM-dependent methyltransferase